MKLKDNFFNRHFIFLNESSFSNNDLRRVVYLIKMVIEKKIGMKLYPFGGENNNYDKFSNSFGSGIGMLFVLDNGMLVRFNWESKKKSSTLTSIDLFDKIRDTVPSKRLIIPTDYNIIKSVDIIANFMKGHKISESLITEKGYSKEKKEASKKYGIDITLPTDKFWKEVEKISGLGGGQFLKYLKSKEPGDKIKSVNGKSEKSKRIKELESASKKMVEYADPDVVFNDLDDLLSMIMSGMQKSLIITGMAGIGKTYNVIQRLKKKFGSEGGNWVLRSGKTSPYGFYQFVYANRNKIIVLDDMDSALKDKDIGGVLKSLLDTTQNNVSWISSLTQNLDNMNDEQRKAYEIELKQQLSSPGGEFDQKLKLPNKFEFTGSIVFISNLYKSDMDSALLSRSMYIDITLTAKDIFKRMETILPNIMPEVKIGIKKEVLNFLKKSQKEIKKTINMRTLLNSIKCKISGSGRWQHLAIFYA